MTQRPIIVRLFGHRLGNELCHVQPCLHRGLDPVHTYPFSNPSFFRKHNIKTITAYLSKLKMAWVLPKHVCNKEICRLLEVFISTCASTILWKHCIYLVFIPPSTCSLWRRFRLAFEIRSESYQIMLSFVFKTSSTKLGWSQDTLLGLKKAQTRTT